MDRGQIIRLRRSSLRRIRRADNRSHTKKPCEIKPGPLSGTWCYLSLVPSATLSFHKENSVIAEGLVSLRVPGLEFTGFVVLCFCCQPSESSVLRGSPRMKKPGADAPGERCSYADSNRDHRRRRPVLSPVKL